MTVLAVPAAVCGSLRQRLIDDMPLRRSPGPLAAAGAQAAE
ncbi:hypothetical protein [Methylobacterium sp. D48H]